MEDRRYLFNAISIPVQNTLWILLLILCVPRVDAQEQDLYTSIQSAKTSPRARLTLRGKVVDKHSQEPLAFSTITLYNTSDTTLLTGAIADQEGFFAIDIPKMPLLLKIEFIAYQAKMTEHRLDVNSSSEVDLGVIELERSFNAMSPVRVNAEKNSIMMQLDKRVFNVGKDLISAGGTAEDVLRNVPGLSVDIDGKLTLRGSNAIRFLLDSRASSLLNHNSLAGLRQIRASQIERVEIITTPSARHEAEGVVGIVNIVLKHNEQKGINGAIVANLGHPDNHGVGTTLNYQKGKMSGFLEVGGWHIDKQGKGHFDNRFYNYNNTDSTYFIDMDRVHNRRHSSMYTRLGLDYYFDPQNTLLSSFSFMGMDGDNKTDIEYIDAIGVEDNIQLITDRIEKEEEHSKDWQGSVTYKRRFKKKGHQLVTSLQYEAESKDEKANYEETFLDANRQLIDTVDFQQIATVDVGRKKLTSNIDYVVPVAKAAKLEIGSQYTHREISNDYAIVNLLDLVVDTLQNDGDQFKYLESIYSGYFNLSCKHHLLSVQAGVRLEHTDANTRLAQTSMNRVWRYTQLFPSAFLSYDLGKNNALQISYNRRVRRPQVRDLNPFFTIRDRRNIFRGNPNIEPQLTDTYELGHVKYWDKGVLSSIAYFKRTTNVIKRLQRLDENDPSLTITQAENLALKRKFGVELIYSYSPSKLWQLSGDVNLYHSYAGGSFEFQDKIYEVGGQSFSMTSKLSSRQKIWKNINSQVILSYSAPRRTTQGMNRSSFATDLAVGADLFNDRMTIVFNVLDLFNSRRRRSYSEDETFYSEDNFLWQNRSFILSAHYRINKQKEKSIYDTPFKDTDKDSY